MAKKISARAPAQDPKGTGEWAVRTAKAGKFVAKSARTGEYIIVNRASATSERVIQKNAERQSEALIRLAKR